MLAASLLLFSSAQAATALPRPAGLEPEVGFWRRVFAECTSEQGLIHDNRHLGIVYEKIDVSGDGGGAGRIARSAENARIRYERILRTLGSGKRSGLTPEEARVLGLWPAGTSSAEFRAAAERVRFQQGLAERFHAGLERSGLWHAHIVESLRAHGVPEEVAALPHVESSFDPNARSFVGAAGLWQFTGETGRRFMRIDGAVDERRDPFESSEAAAKLLKYNYSVLGTWPLAITAYNHGTAGMRRAAERMGTTDIETLVRRYDGPAFGFASRNFYVSFLAALEIEQNAEKYFGPVQRRAPREELIVELPDYMRVDTLEKAFGVPRSTLQAYNPALLPPVWEGAKYVPRGFRLRLPADGVIEAAPHQVLASVPASQRFGGQVPDKTHKVKRGDTLSRIAQRYGTTVTKLAQANGIKAGARIRVGQVLKLPAKPGAAPAPVAVARAEAPTAARPAGTPPPPAARPADAPAFYVVRAGDSLARVAAVTGVSQRELVALNGLGDANHIRIGQKLRLVPAETQVAAASAPAPARAPAATPAAATATPAAGIATPAPGAAPTPAAPARVAARPPVAAGPPPALAAANQPAVEDPAQPAGETGGTAASLADPSDYLVADDDTVEVQAAETMTHYAGWLGITPDRLRQANGWPKQRALVLGQRVRLDFSQVSRDTFLSRRVAYHHDLQEDYFTRYRITDTTEHRLRRGESVWVLAAQKYKVPVWLLRQYNPTLDLDQLRPGTRVVFPRVVRVADAAADGDSLAGVR